MQILTKLSRLFHAVPVMLTHDVSGGYVVNEGDIIAAYQKNGFFKLLFSSRKLIPLSLRLLSTRRTNNLFGQGICVLADEHLCFLSAKLFQFQAEQLKQNCKTRQRNPRAVTSCVWWHLSFMGEITLMATYKR
ncbi:hypothetical protein HanRHA438_Chr13g0627611 [Helianthus annuus]|nr:hypothetical protein HanRHA438_Chr13g0627611 [Helianthus annuus]